ncbi:hypothetical protein F5J12DRAFT_456632 [Pisolithus orientalis]|uniref:uncharacterized protein n=1 Tax=Pisolithus orientalis TaxID=936130 RepID=UPI0022240F57|nr:uncharacterized protein F5J12DRAFT_456632 [Pisolithus orientalis]KAI6025976.1 hypothetical protein F5J12DRAFT_456632 [Pisolithus orientalis]
MAPSVSSLPVPISVLVSTSIWPCRWTQWCCCTLRTPSTVLGRASPVSETPHCYSHCLQMPLIGGMDGRAQGGAEGTGNLIARRESVRQHTCTRWPFRSLG